MTIFSQMCLTDLRYKTCKSLIELGHPDSKSITGDSVPTVGFSANSF